MSQLLQVISRSGKRSARSNTNNFGNCFTIHFWFLYIPSRCLPLYFVPFVVSKSPTATPPNHNQPLTSNWSGELEETALQRRWYTAGPIQSRRYVLFLLAFRSGPGSLHYVYVWRMCRGRSLKRNHGTSSALCVPAFGGLRHRFWPRDPTRETIIRPCRHPETRCGIMAHDQNIPSLSSSSRFNQHYPSETPIGTCNQLLQLVHCPRLHRPGGNTSMPANTRCRMISRCCNSSTLSTKQPERL